MINISNLNAGYSKKNPVLHGVSCTLSRGSVYGLLGENGSGKTTLIKTLAGIISPKAGKVEVFGTPPINRTLATLSEVFYIPDEIEMPSLSVENFVNCYSPFYSKFSREKFYANLSTLGFTPNKRLDKLSMGNRKKVLVSFALASGVSFILMDEPTNGLDINSKKAFKRLLLSVDSSELIVVLSSHLLDDISELLSDILILRDSELLVNSSLENIASKFVFKSVNECDKPAFIDGFRTIGINEHDDDTDVDIELFYSAVYENEKFRSLASELLLKGDKDV